MIKSSVLVLLLLALSSGVVAWGVPWSVTVEKPIEYIKLGPSPVLSMTPSKGDEGLLKYCNVRQSKLTTYVKMPYRHLLPMANYETPYHQVVNMKDFSFIIYREAQGKEVHTMMLSKLLGAKLQSLDLRRLTQDIPNSGLNFYTDLSHQTLGDEFHIYLRPNNFEIYRITLNKDMSLHRIRRLALDRKVNALRVFVNNGNIYFLEFNKLTKISPSNSDFSKYSKEEITLKREYSDMALIGNVFIFIRGFSKMILSGSFNPEGSKAVVRPETYHHAKFHYSGFNKFIFSASDQESGPTQYYYFEAPAGSKEIDQLKLKLLNGKIPSKGLLRLVHFKESIYYIYKKQIRVQYLNSPSIVEMDKPVYGEVYGVVGTETTNIDGVGIIQGFRVGIKSKIRLRKLYVNSMQSELVCKAIPELKLNESKVFHTKVTTRKNELNLQITFKGTPYTIQNTSHPELTNKEKQIKKQQAQEAHNKWEDKQMQIHMKELEKEIKELKEKELKQSKQRAKEQKAKDKETDEAKKLRLKKQAEQEKKRKEDEEKAKQLLESERARNEKLKSEALKLAELAQRQKDELKRKEEEIQRSTIKQREKEKEIQDLQARHKEETELLNQKLKKQQVKTSTPPKNKTLIPDPSQATQASDDQQEFYKRLFYYFATACLVLLLIVLCLMRNVLKRQVRDMEQAHDAIGSTISTSGGEQNMEESTGEQQEGRERRSTELSVQQPMPSSSTGEARRTEEPKKPKEQYEITTVEDDITL